MPKPSTRVQADAETPRVVFHTYPRRPPIVVVKVGGVETVFDAGGKDDAEVARAIAAAYLDAAQRIERWAGITRPVIVTRLADGVPGISATVAGGLPVTVTGPGACDDIAAAFVTARNELAARAVHASEAVAP